MKSFSNLILYTFFGVFISFPAQAYLDPGTGSLLIQGILAAVTSIGVALKLYWSKIVKLVNSMKKKGRQGQMTTDDDHNTKNRT